MKKYVIITLALLFGISFWNCEKDDLCNETTPTTPNVVIEFYDSVNQTTLKNVTNLALVVDGDTLDINYTVQSKILIPLKTFTNATTITFVLNGNDTDSTNDSSDELTFNYERNDVYISRACGYKTLFQLNSSDGITTNSNNWIEDINIIEANINNENETHVKIYF